MKRVRKKMDQPDILLEGFGDGGDGFGSWGA